MGLLTGNAMNAAQELFFSATGMAFDFLEKEYAYRRVAEVLENEDDFRDARSIVRYLGKVVGVEVSWYYSAASISVVFTELSHGEFPESRMFWGEHSGKSRATDLYTIVAVRTGDTRGFLLGDIPGLTYSKIKKREQLIKTSLPLILQNLKELCIRYASDVIGGDLSIFPDAMKYQQDMIEKRRGG